MDGPTSPKRDDEEREAAEHKRAAVIVLGSVVVGILALVISAWILTRQ